MQFEASDFESWSISEYARRRIARGHRVHEHDGVWWEQVRPRFCWPLDSLSVPIASARPAWSQAVAGYHHLVATPDKGNSWMNPMILDDVASYGIEKLDSKRRNLVRKGLKSATVRPLRGPDELSRDGWLIETEFFARTNWKPPPSQMDWPAHARRAFDDPVIDHELGAFVGDRMVGYMAWCGIERTAHLTHIATSHEGLKACANDALLFEWVNMLRESGLYDRAAYAVRSFKPSLDAFKAEHLFRLRSLPARLVVNPILRWTLQRVRPHFIERLKGMDESAAHEWLASARSSSKS